MTNCIFGLPDDNRVLTGALSASAAATGLGASNLADDHGATSTSWQTPAGTTSAYFQLDGGGGATWDVLGFFNSNLTPAATVRWRLSDDATFATSISDSGVLSGPVVAGYRQALRVLAATVTARYLRVDIADTANPEGVLRVAQAFAGVARRPTRNFSYTGTTFRRAASVGAQRSRGGQTFADFRFSERAWAIGLPTLGRDEAWTLAQDLQRQAEAGGNVLFIPNPEGSHLAREAVFGLLSAAGEIGRPQGAPLLRSWSLTITERL
jgi:hypothetical protein